MSLIKVGAPVARMWADYDPHAAKGQRYAFYSSRREQREVRPDLKPFRVLIWEDITPPKRRR